MIGIYKIENLVNGKVYIGQAQDIEKRWKSHKSHMNTSNQVLYLAMRKYGFENFSFEILIECEEELLDLMEIYYIKKYNSYIHWENSNGYNMTTGGQSNTTRGHKMSLYTRKKLSEKAKNRSLETRKRISESKIGRKLSKREVEVIKERTCGANNPNSKRVICDGKTYSYAGEFADKYKLNRSVVCGWLSHRYRMPKEWYDKGLRYEDEPMSSYTYTTIKNPSKIQVYCDGMIFESIQQLCDYYNEDHATMHARLTHKVDMPLCYYYMNLHIIGDETPHNLSDRNKPVFCNGRVYENLKKISEQYSLNPTSISQILNGKRKPPKRLDNFELRYATVNEIIDYKRKEVGKCLYV